MSENRLSAVPLLAFAEALGIAETIRHEREGPKVLTYEDLEFLPEAAAHLPFDVVAELANTYGRALSCRFRIGALPILDISSETTQADLDGFRQELRSSATSLHFEMTIDKEHLITEATKAPDHCRLFFYFFADMLARFLSSSDLGMLESQLWGDVADHKIVFLVADRDILLDGPHISVIGGKKLGDWQRYVSQQHVDAVRLSQMYSACRDNLNWETSWLQHLTPLHLVTDAVQDTSVDKTIATILRVHLVNMIILYTADRTIAHKESSQLVSTYARAHQSVEINHASPQAGSLHIPGDGVNALVQLLEWSYHPQWTNDRLLFVQTAVVHSVQSAPPDFRYVLLLHNASGILDAVNWHWKAFIDERVEDYLGQVRALEEDVGKTIQQFTREAADMIAGLSNTMLAAVAALIGSFIAALFQEEPNPEVFRIGMLVYAAYVLLFPLGYGMTHRWRRFAQLSNAFEHRRRVFEQQLYPDKVSEIVDDQIDTSRRSFWWWFWATFAAYVMVIGLAMVAEVYVPDIITDTAGTGSQAERFLDFLWSRVL